MLQPSQKIASGHQVHLNIILRYISIIRTNACAFDGGVGRGGIRILHPSLATMNHSCLVSPWCLVSASLSGGWNLMCLVRVGDVGICGDIYTCVTVMW